MTRSGYGRLVVLGVMASHSAAAQVIWDIPKIVVPKPKFDDSTIKPRADAWPRLDPGAVLCKTEADLQRLAASRRGEPGERPNCQLIRSPTPIQVERRAGPGRIGPFPQNGQTPEKPARRAPRRP